MQSRKIEKKILKDMILVSEVELEKCVVEQSSKNFEVLTHVIKQTGSSATAL